MDTNKKTTLTKEVLKDKIQGILYGTALGDGLGLATEFMSTEQAKTLYGNGPIKFGKGSGHAFYRDGFRNRWFENDFTDDTDQSILILQCLLADNGVLNPLHVIYRIKEWCCIGLPELDNKPPRGIGMTVGSTCSHPKVLSDPFRASYNVWNTHSRDLAPNGALMRTGVVGAPSFWDERKVVENAMMAAKVTHADPRAVISAVIVSVLISQLLRGHQPNERVSLTEDEEASTNDRKHLTEMMEFGSKDDNGYLEMFSSFAKPSAKVVHTSRWKKALRQIRRGAAYITGEPIDPIFLDFNFAKYPTADPERLKNPAPIRPDVKPIAEYGSDDHMMKLCKNVVNKYKFLVEGHSLCPDISAKEEKATKEEKTDTISWVDQLYQHCFPESLTSLKLNERGKIGYAFKCLGAALYLGTRKQPEEMTSAEFFENLITELLLEAGDADTNCAAAGALLGCRLGKSGLPKKWVEGVRHKNFLERTSNELASIILANMEKEVQ